MSKNNNRWLRLLTILLSLLSFSGLCCLPPAAEAQTTGSITGKVIDSTGNPIKNLTVGVSLAAKQSFSKSAITGDDGTYAISEIQFGDYKVLFAAVASNLDYTDQWYDNKATFAEATVVSLTLAQAARDLGETVLVSGAVIKGIVTDQSSGKVIEGVTVQAIDVNDSNNFVSGLTNSSGVYTISGLRAGSYKVRFRAFGTNYTTEWYNEVADENNARILDITAGEVKTGINAKLSAGGSISGKITVNETGAGIAGAWINVYDAADNTLKGYTATGTDGSYMVGGLSASKYKVQFFERKATNNAGAGINKWYDGKTDIATADQVDVGRTDVDAAFNGATISGTVTKAGGGGIEGVTVEVYDSSGKKVASSNQTGTDGMYNIAGLLRGDYKLYFKAFETNYVSEWYNDASTMSAASSMSITSLANALIGNAELASGGSISGTVQIQRNPDSSPVPVDGGLVQVYDSADSSILTGAATTRSDGTYEVTGLPTSGNFKVRFFSSAAADGSAGYGISEWYDNQHSFDQATPVSIGSPAAVDAVLEPSNLIPAYKLLLLKPRP